MREREAGADRHLGADNAVPAEEIFLPAKHVHGAAFAFGITAFASGQLGHNSFGIHAGGQHMTVITITGDQRVLFFGCRHQANDYSFLADIKVTEATDESHTVQLPCLFFKSADLQHFTVITDQLLCAGRLCRLGSTFSCFG